MNYATAVEGSLPSAPGEIGIEHGMSDALGLSIGDTLTISSERGGKSCLVSNDFVISAIVEHPAYISISTAYARGGTTIGDGEQDFYVLVSESAFNKEAYDNCYSDVYVRCDSLRDINSFSDSYLDKSDVIAAQIKELGDNLGLARYTSVIERYRAELADAEKKIKDAEAVLAEKEQLLADAGVELIDGKAEYRVRVEQLAAAKAELLTVCEKINGFSAELLSVLEEAPEIIRVAVEDKMSGLGIVPEDLVLSTDPAEAQEQIEVVRALVSFLSFYADSEAEEWDSLKTKIQIYREAYDDAPDSAEKQAALDSLHADLSLMNIEGNNIAFAEQQVAAYGFAYRSLSKLAQKTEGVLSDFDDKITQCLDGEAALTQADTDIREAADEIARNTLLLDNAKAELSGEKAKAELARNDFENLTVFDSWVVKTRSENFSYGIALAFSNSGHKLCYSLSLLFVFVGVMVCYTAISRIVREQQVMTGVQKSLGFRRREIMTQYLSYAGAAVLLGALLGAALGYFVIEPIMNNSFAPNFLMGKFKPYFRITELLIISAAELILISFSAWLACRKLLAKPAVNLLRGNGDSVGHTHFYEKFNFWDKLSLYTQTTINNVVNDKTRVIATLVGVAGCTSLIVMALTVQMAMINTPAKHFSEISLYDNRLVSDDEIPGAMDSLSVVLENENVDYTKVYQKGVLVGSGSGELTSASLLVPSEPMNLSAFVRLLDKSSGRPLYAPAEGVIISGPYARNYHVHEGDNITLTDMTGNKYTCAVVGITRYYLSSTQVVMSSAYYEKLTGASADANTFLVSLNGANAQELNTKLKEIPGYFSFSDDTARWTALYQNYQSSISLMVYIALFLSAVMALLVILNLNVVLINEKSKELIVMRINGYSVGAAKKYIYRDNVVLTMLGTIIGVLAGIGLGVLVVFSLVSKNSNLIMSPSLPACLAGAAVSIVFSLITNLIALRRIGKLRVSDLNK